MYAFADKGLAIFNRGPAQLTLGLRGVKHGGKAATLKISIAGEHSVGVASDALNCPLGESLSVVASAGCRYAPQLDASPAL